MNILIAPDKFKGSLSARQVCEAIALGLKQKDESLNCTLHPMADGGDDSLTILAEHLALKKKKVRTQDPLGRSITATYFTSSDAAFIEVASASGLVLLKQSERNPMLTSTLGTGKLIVDAIQKGYNKIYLFLGGSATNDAGMGIAHTLGVRFLDAENNILRPIGQNLKKIVTIKNKKQFDFDKISINIFYDVVNPLFGKNGAAYIYAPQKGASSQDVNYLDDGLRHFCKIIQQQIGIDISLMAGGGAAGGIGAGIVALCGAQMNRGFDLLAKLTKLEQKIKQADWVISGEGKLDAQSLQGKVIDGIAHLCTKHGKPLTLFVGKNELSKQQLQTLSIHKVLSIHSIATNKEDAMHNAAHYLSSLAKNSLGADQSKPIN